MNWPKRQGLTGLTTSASFLSRQAVHHASCCITHRLTDNNGDKYEILMIRCAAVTPASQHISIEGLSLHAYAHTINSPDVKPQSRMSSQ